MEKMLTIVSDIRLSEKIVIAAVAEASAIGFRVYASAADSQRQRKHLCVA